MRVPGNILDVAALHPDYMGLIFYPKSKRYVADLDPMALRGLPSKIQKTGVFVDETLEQVLAMQEKYQLDAIQLHGSESADFCNTLKQLLQKNVGLHAEVLSTEVAIIKAFGIDEQFDFSTLDAYEGLVDFFLFDTKTPDHGGSGRMFEWSLLDRYKLSIPYFLSGGLDLDSAAVIGELNDPRLAAIDLNSKFETAPGLKDVNKLRAFKSRFDHNKLQG